MRLQRIATLCVFFAEEDDDAGGLRVEGRRRVQNGMFDDFADFFVADRQVFIQCVNGTAGFGRLLQGLISHFVFPLIDV